MVQVINDRVLVAWNSSGSKTKQGAQQPQIKNLQFIQPPSCLSTLRNYQWPGVNTCQEYYKTMTLTPWFSKKHSQLKIRLNHEVESLDTVLLQQFIRKSTDYTFMEHKQPNQKKSKQT